MAKINVLNKEITISTRDEEDYICITDIARYKNSDRTDDHGIKKLEGGKK
jgi:hypothetical protein